MDLFLSESTTEKFVYMGKIQNNPFKIIVPATIGLTQTALTRRLKHVVTLFFGNSREQEFSELFFI